MPIVGSFTNLAEASKLVQPILLQGVVEEVIRTGSLLPKLPVFTIDSKEVRYNREKSLPTATGFGIHETLSWKSDIDLGDQVTVELKYFYDQKILDDQLGRNWKNPNDYESIVVKLMAKGLAHSMESRVIYGNCSRPAWAGTFNTMDFDGLWVLAFPQLRENHPTGGPLSLSRLREMLDSVKFKIDFLVMPHAIARRLDALLLEGGNALTTIARLTVGADEVGRRLLYFDGIPVIRSDFMTMTEGDSAPTGGSNGSIFAVHLGQIAEGGLCMATGAETKSGGPNMFEITRFEKLEDYYASGIRMVASMALALGSTKAIGHLCNITDAAVVA